MFFGKRFHGHTRGDLSGLDILVLSIIRNKEGISGYDIGQVINRQFRGMWKASPGTIYPLLSRLAEKGYVTIKEITENNRLKKLYSITPTGREKLKSVLDNNLSNSINTLFEYVNTIIKGFSNMPDINDCFCSWPSPGGIGKEGFDETDYSKENFKRVRSQITHLKNKKQKHQEIIESINAKLEQYNGLLKTLEEGRVKYERIIETTSNEADFDN